MPYPIRLFRAGAASLILLTTGARICSSGELRRSSKLIHTYTAQDKTNTQPVAPAFLTSALNAANAHDPAALAALAVPAAAPDFAWAKSRTTARWQVDALTPPMGADPNVADASGVHLVVFHAWHTCQSDGDHVHTLEQGPDGWKIGREIPETETGGFRVRDHDLNVSLDAGKKTAAITDVVSIERTAETNPPYALLRLSQDFAVTQVRRDSATGAVVPFQQAGGVLAFVPPAEKTFKLFLSYAGSVNHRGSDYIRENEATLNSYWYPHIARLPAKATVTATTPPGWTVIGQGEPGKSERDASGVQTATFRNEMPVCYYTLDMGRYTITSRTIKGRPLSVYLLSNNAGLAKSCLDMLEDALKFDEATFGPLPYSRYTVVETQGPFGGALEGYSLATFGPGTLPETIPHELSHTWWGGVVPNPYTRSMWNEGFAEYSDRLFRRSKAGATERAPRTTPVQRRAMREYMGDTLLGAPLASARDTSDGVEGAIGYGKGWRVLRVLEEQIGQEAMKRCLAAFTAQHTPGEAGDWAEWEAVVRKVTGQDYRWFFAQWIERTGIPSLLLSQVKTQKEGDATWITAHITQTTPPYRLRLPISIELQGGMTTTQTVDVDGPDTAIRLRVMGSPRRIILDPEGKIPFTVPSNGDPAFEFSASQVGLKPRSKKQSSPTRNLAAVPRENRAVGLHVSERRSNADAVAHSPRLVRCAAVQDANDAFRDVFLKRVAKIVNASDVDGFRSLFTSGVEPETQWMTGQSALAIKDAANIRPWRALPLALPTGEAASDAPVTLVVLTRYHPAESQGDHIYALTKDDAGKWRLGREYVEDAQGEANSPRIRSHAAQITLDPPTGTLRAVDTLNLALPDAPGGPYAPIPNVYLLRLNDTYRVDSIESGGADSKERKPVPFQQAGGIITFRYSRSASSGQTETEKTSTLPFVITYHGQAAQSGEDFITSKEAALSGYYLPHIGRLPVEYTTRLTVPRGWSAFTQGEMRGKTVSADSKTVTFEYRNAMPVCYPSLTAGPYQVVSEPARKDGFAVSVAYLHREDKAIATSALRTARAALSFYADKFAPFPYSRYTVVVSDRYAMALEGYSMMTIARSYVPNVLPHEIAHTWWGGVVPNTYLRDLWNESFAEYADGLYQRMTKRSDGMHEMEMSQVRAAGLLNRTLPVSIRRANDPLDVGQSIVGYIKGSAVLETLEDLAGREKMLRAIRTFVADKKPGEPATWDDFIAAFVKTAGEEWRGFFNGWLTTTGVPTLSLANTRIETGAKGRAVVGEITQTGEAVFWQRVPIRLRLKDGTLLNQNVAVRATRTPFRFALPAKATPDVVDLDPFSRALRSLNGGVTQKTLSKH